MAVIPSGDEFEKHMQRFIDQDDHGVRQYIKKIAHPDFDERQEVRTSETTNEFLPSADQALWDELERATSELSEADKALVYQNLRLVPWFGTTYIDRLSLREIITAGNKGLIATAKNFSFEGASQFENRSYLYVRRAILQELAEQRTKREEKKPHLLRGEEENDDDDTGKEDHVIASKVTGSLLRDDMVEVMASLSPRERDLLRLRFGLDDGKQRTLEEVAQLYGMTSERVREMEAKAFKKLRHPNR